MTAITVLGATGSIGVSTLDVVARHPDRFRVVALTAHSQVERLLEQCQVHRPRYAVVVEPVAAERFQRRADAMGLDVEVLAGPEGLETVAALPEVDAVMAAIVGAAGLVPTLAAARCGKRVLLANKEALVMSGGLFMEEVRRSGATLLPIDSEHNAVFQCLPMETGDGLEPAGVRRILLTASGGPFRDWPLADLDTVTPEQAVSHPNWSMGRKISVDSATMMNKGLEVIEACWLFDARPEQVEVVLHPQSIVHSLVEYIDGSTLAQMGNPDMRTPIAHALAWPDRIESGVTALDLVSVGRFDFMPPDLERFPCLRLAGEALRAGGTATAVLNGANEIAVAAFLDDGLPYPAIPRVLEAVLDEVPPQPMDSLETVLEADRTAREAARRRIAAEGVAG